MNKSGGDQRSYFEIDCEYSDFIFFYNCIVTIINDCLGGCGAVD
jgi:hypothetical protein